MTNHPATRPDEGVVPPEHTDNAKVNGVKKGKTKPRATSKASKVHCLCRRPDDGSPMIRCDDCKEWSVSICFLCPGSPRSDEAVHRYHFRCVKLEERDAEEIQTYICAPCHKKTGLRTIREWEGVDGIEEVQEARIPSEEPPPTVPDGEDDEQSAGSVDDGSEDEYVAEKARPKTGKRRPGRVWSDSDTEPDESKQDARAHKKARRTSSAAREVSDRSSPSPHPNGHSRRKQSSASQPQQPEKRVRSESGEDPARKYCLTKLQEIFSGIFLRYPYLRVEETGRERPEEITEPDKKQEELTDEEKEKLGQTANRFAAELEECIYELYAEPDKNGKRSAAGKYKERFRMLTFNLSKSDRVVLHKRIASLHITAKELSTMSSTDLADEETKHAIRQAEQEALAHSILKKQTLPRAKITHKGIENIEDVSGAVQRDLERAREEEEEENWIERERMARLKLQAERARSASSIGQGSVPPESPVVPQTPTWGAPPSMPMHQMQAESAMTSMGRPPANPLFVPSASDYAPTVENELNLADLINIDEDLSADITSPVPPTPTPFGNESPLSINTNVKSPEQSQPSETSPPPPSTGISPFAARDSKPDIALRASFDLNSLWTPKEPESATEQSPDVHMSDSAVEDKQRESTVDMDILGPEADDQDFDMFLGKDEDEKIVKASPEDNSPEAQRAAFEALPRVWTGTLSMPLDSAMAQNVSLNARQMGGRILGGDSPLWQTLFPSKELRIDGRVPVEKSAQYLTQMRLNSSKELIAVAFSPEPGGGIENIGFKTLADHLLAKGRHGLVFPWGNRPKDWAPGRELYIIPLLVTEAIPDYMELLDDLRLPRIRGSDYLIGVWVLNKGKLAPPSAPPAPPPHLTASIPQAESLFSSLSSQPPAQAPQYQPNAPVAALAAEVAQLTPEQIQLMLRTLASSALIPQQPAAAPQPIMPSMPSMLSMPSMSPPQAQQAIPLQPWLNPSLSYPPGSVEGVDEEGHEEEGRGTMTGRAIPVGRRVAGKPEEARPVLYVVEDGAITEDGVRCYRCAE
ncbi:hypothetical protein WOLCODRAFT_133175 [Wolfiporia cocos MD-104 SS10]|uniref:Transcription factor BYE1 n=1 Tax=Wolfiporia cocos (strain MD-104) TaxID=742152 RepID=A0A2H3JS75_WOLCO|nr:hypothetical protein WOLCODRAFT_133175 [Wolfiporia cocos MD-104 SS10]